MDTSQSAAPEARVRTAYKIMQGVFDSCKATGDSPHQIDAAIRAAYPWGERRAWPYKAWLQARREFYEKNELPLRRRATIEEAIQDARS